MTNETIVAAMFACVGTVLLFGLGGLGVWLFKQQSSKPRNRQYQQHRQQGVYDVVRHRHLVVSIYRQIANGVHYGVTFHKMAGDAMRRTLRISDLLLTPRAIVELAYRLENQRDLSSADREALANLREAMAAADLLIDERQTQHANGVSSEIDVSVEV